MNLAEILKAQSVIAAERAAIIDTRHGRTRVLTFGQLETAAARAAALLQSTGLRPGDGVLIFEPMSAELYVALAAIFRFGLVGVFIDPAAGKEHIERCCALYPPRALIASAKAHLLRIALPGVRRIPIKFSVGLSMPGARNWASYEHFSPSAQIQSCAPETPALVTFTSGSTGACKAAVRTHGFLLAQHKALEKNLKLEAGELDLSTLPVFVLANLASAVTSLIADADLTRPGFIDPAPVVSQIRLLKPNRTTASPAFLERLAEYCRARGWTLPELKKIFLGGAPVFPRLLVKLKTIAPESEIVSVYGSTEAEPMAHIAHKDTRSDDFDAMLRGQGLLAGAPVAEINLRIIGDRWGKPIGPYTRDEFAAACLPPGRTGEIVVSGDHVLPGYLNGGGNQENKFTVEHAPWHRTGDAGYLDSQGRLWLLGRCAACVKDKHGMLNPFAVECAAHSLESVQRAAVVSRNGRRILAVEQSNSNTRNDFTSLAPILAQAHVEEIRVLKSIPVDRRHNGKTDYPALRKLLDSANKEFTSK